MSAENVWLRLKLGSFALLKYRCWKFRNSSRYDPKLQTYLLISGKLLKAVSGHTLQVHDNDKISVGVCITRCMCSLGTLSGLGTSHYLHTSLKDTAREAGHLHITILLSLDHLVNFCHIVSIGC